MNIAIYTNILTPYRKHFYDALYNECKKKGDDFHVLVMADTEPNRNWIYDDFKTGYTTLLKHKTLTIGEVYIHFNQNLRKTLIGLDLDILICAGGYLCPGIQSVLRWKKSLGYKTYFWSESHLNEQRAYSNIKIMLREYIRKTVYEKFDGFWYAGKLSREFIEKYAGRNADFYFIPNLIDEKKYAEATDLSESDRYKLQEKYQLDPHKKVFLCPARLSRVKGIDKFITILKKAEQRNQVTILIAGDGELHDEINEKVEREGLDIRLLGYQNQNMMVELYSIADVFLLPSISDPNPLTCIEALWAGLPLFISEHCGNYPEVIKEGQNGYVFSYNNIETALIKLEKLINAKNEWIKNARRVSYQLAAEKYNTRKVVESVLKYYRGLCNKEDD